MIGKTVVYKVSCLEERKWKSEEGDDMNSAKDRRGKEVKKEESMATSEYRQDIGRILNDKFQKR